MLSTSHGFWLDFSLLYRLRKIFLEIGLRLADRGDVNTAQDAFYLTLQEMKLSLSDSYDGELRPIILDCLAEIQRFENIDPPAALGTSYGPMPDDFISSTIAAIYGISPDPDGDRLIIRGIAASAGCVKGPVTILRSPHESAKLQKGDILVAETTAPPWTPFFAIASAVVTETGGVLSHCAVVAREYKIPAVVGAPAATARLKDGQLVLVDGNRGIVILDPETE